jgi:hypothetical protein
MTLHGIFRSGVVVLEGGAALPEGTPVTVLVEQNQAGVPPAQGERMRVFLSDVQLLLANESR